MANEFCFVEMRIIKNYIKTNLLIYKNLPVALKDGTTSSNKARSTVSANKFYFYGIMHYIMNYTFQNNQNYFKAACYYHDGRSQKPASSVKDMHRRRTA